MKRLIVNADDFGLHPLVNQAVLQGHLRGCITSASLMPTGAAFAEAAELALRTPSLGVGVHLTLVAGRPALAVDEVKSLVNADGVFPEEHTAFILSYARGKIRMDEVYCELAAQIERVARTGIPVTHLDSHQHLHVLPAVMDICVELAKRYGIKAMRIPAEPYCFSGGFHADVKRWIGKCGLTFLASRAKKKALQNGIAVPEYFFGMLVGGHLSRRYFANMLLALPDGYSEIMMHPAAHSDTMREVFGWDYCWETELAAALDPDILKMMRERHIKLSSFGELSHE